MSEHDHNEKSTPIKTNASTAMDGLTIAHLQKGLTTAHIKQQFEQAAPQTTATASNATTPHDQTGTKSTEQSS